MIYGLSAIPVSFIAGDMEIVGTATNSMGVYALELASSKTLQVQTQLRQWR
jgi:hypothetical protein